MSIVKRISVRNIHESDNGIELKEAFKLVENFTLKDELINQFDIDLEKNIFLNIKGATTLVNCLLNLEESVEKFDIDTELKDIHISGFKDKNQIGIEVWNVNDPNVLTHYETDKIAANSAYSVRHELLDTLYQADKYLTHLNKLNQDELIELNIKELENINIKNPDSKKLRFIENEDGDLFVRAITSTNVYKDYNICFSVFITLYQLSILNSNSDHKFEVEQFSFDDSEISVLFKETNNEEIINDNVYLSFALELTNSEIKNKAVKLNGNFIIETADFSVYTKNNIKTTVLSIAHGNTIKKAKEYISILPENINNFVEGSLNNYKNIGKIKKFEDIQNHLAGKLQKANNKEIRKYNSEFQNILKGQIKSLFELLEKMYKIEQVIAEEDIKSIDFLRGKIFDSIIKRGR